MKTSLLFILLFTAIFAMVYALPAPASTKFQRAVEFQGDNKESIQALLDNLKFVEAALIQDDHQAKIEKLSKRFKNFFRRLVGGINFAINGPGSGPDMSMGGGPDTSMGGGPDYDTSMG